MSDQENSNVEENLPESAFSMKFARLIMRYRFATLMMKLTITMFFSLPLINAILYNATFDPATGEGKHLPGLETRFKIDSSLRDTYPEHPFIHAQDKFTGRFGTASQVAVAVVKMDPETGELDQNGDIYDTEFLEKVKRITNAVDEAPFINHYQVRSIAHMNTRIINIQPDGGIDPEILMEEIPEDDEDLDLLRQRIHENPGLIYGFLVSSRGEYTDKAIQIIGGFITHRLDNREAYENLFNYMQNLKAEEEADGTAKVYITGQPMAVGWTYVHAFEITMFLLLTIVMSFFLLWAYFRRLHGIAIPMVAGLSTAIWGMGFTAWLGINMDPLILVVPLLITARAISHTMQMSERFFEDYEMEVHGRERDKGRQLTEEEITDAKVETATTAMAKLMMPGMLGIITDAAGLLVILLTSIQQMRNLAIFGSFWVLAIFFNVILFHPIQIAYMPPPHEAEHYTPKWIVYLLTLAGRISTGMRSKYVLVGLSAVFLVGATYYVLFNAKIGDTKAGFPIFWPDHEFNISTGKVASLFGGVDQFTIFIDGDQNNASSDGTVLQNMELMQRHMRKFASPGIPNEPVDLSLINIIKTYWAVNHNGDPKWAFVPDSGGTVGGIIFQLQQRGAPGALRPFLTDDSEDANIQFFFKNHTGETITEAVHWARDFIDTHPMGRMNIRLNEDKGGPLDVVYYMLGPVLFPRNAEMSIRVADIDSDTQEILGYQTETSRKVGEWVEPLDEAEVEKTIVGELVQMAPRKVESPGRDTHLDDDLGIPRKTMERIARNLSQEFDFRIETATQSAANVSMGWLTIGDIVDHVVERSEYYVVEEWDATERGIKAQSIRYCRSYCPYELWVKNEKFKDRSWNPQQTGSWTRGSEFVLAGGYMGVLAATNEEVERGHVANILLIFVVVFVFVGLSYRSASAGMVIVFSLAMGTVISLFYMALRGTGLNVNTLPVQSVGVGIGVDYALYVTDRIRQEYSWCGDLDEGIRRAIRTTGMAVSFTATTLIAGIGAWMLSELRFQAEMAQLLCILMFVNMLGAILLVPALFSILRPTFFAASLSGSAEQPNEEVEEGQTMMTGTA